MPLNTSNVSNYQYLRSGRNKGEAVSPASRFMLLIGPGFEPGEQFQDALVCELRVAIYCTI